MSGRVRCYVVDYCQSLNFSQFDGRCHAKLSLARAPSPIEADTRDKAGKPKAVGIPEREILRVIV